MSVYIEAVIIENLLLDGLLLALAHTLSGAKHRWWSVAIGSAIGTAFVVAMPFLRLGGWLMLALKLAVGGLMVGVSAAFKGCKQMLCSLAFFLALTFLSGGALIGLSNMLNGSFCAIKATNFFFSSKSPPIFCVMLGGGALIFLSFRLLFFARRRADIRPLARKVALFEGGESAYLDGLVDTGNTLYDSRTLKPVCMINPTTARRLVEGGVISMRGKRFIRCATVTGEGVIAVFEIDRLVIYSGDKRHIIDNAIMGVSPKEHSNAEVIVHAALVMGEQ